MKDFKFLNALLICGFFFILTIPNLVMLLGDSKAKLELDYHKPKESLVNFKYQYTEHFGLKDDLFRLYKNIKTKTFHDPVLPDRVVKGLDGWFFLGNHNNNLLNDHFGNNPISNSDRYVITKKIEAIRTQLQQRGIALILMVPPNKHTIYGEYLPFQLSQHPTVVSQLKSHFKATLDVDLLDVSKTLLTHKDQHQLYYRTNTHWTDIGAFYGYQELMKSIQQQISFPLPLVNLNDYEQITMPIENADITKMIQLNTDEQVVYLHKKSPEKATFVNSDASLIHFRNSTGKLKLLMYKDSFANALIPFLNESFEKTWYTTDYRINYDFIDQIKPDIVVIEIVERNLVYNLINSKKPLE